MIYETLNRPEFKLLQEATVGTWTQYERDYYENPAYAFRVELTTYRRTAPRRKPILRVLTLLNTYPHTDVAQKQLHDDEDNTEC